ncbi:ribosome biogenesis factor YjgA [Sphaerotilus sp.]|uniref:ribosome biogenesis factor YjgA n=1 Tax=Sphaerotilus sp. TaxID=2093942 RepID=UPI002ACE9A12|nr:ribosome biogenesis factor YjgA [Sphaerotilus sp.]MDZ7856530.1 ribosome biogenesis factor YjgA [Sphaerotilus sp.]
MPAHEHFDHDDEFAPARDDDFADRPSKTRLKKEMHDLQALGKELIEMPDARLTALGMPEFLLDALLQLKRTRSHEGRRRQWQYVGKLMRRVDAEPLREAVASFKVPGARETLALHTAERWRERLLAEDDALTQWMAEHPDTDAQSLRTLIRNTRKEQLAAAAAQPHDGVIERKGRAYRDLFQRIKSALEAAAKADEQAAALDDGDDEEDDDE